MSEMVKRVGEVSHPQLQAYLQSKSWIEDGKIRSVATVWHRDGDRDAEIVVPFPYVRDYRHRLREALDEVASFEGRTVLEVISDIDRLFANVISVKVIHDDTEGGTIPINDGVLLISKAKDLVISSAMSLSAKRKHFTSGPAKDIRDYVDTLLLGQTEVGSYVVNVIAPLQSSSSETSTAEAVPLAKAVALNLVTGLEALSQATMLYDEAGNLHVFDDAVAKGASANMCDALLGFSGSNRNRSFEVKVSPSTGSMFDAEPRTFKFEAHQVEVLVQASSYYKEDYVLPDRTLAGYVRKLNRPKEDSSGTISLDTKFGGVDRTVKIELGQDDYHNAVLAHDNGSLVQCSGDVHVKSRSASLKNPHGFRVVTIGDLI